MIKQQTPTMRQLLATGIQVLTTSIARVVLVDVSAALIASARGLHPDERALLSVLGLFFAAALGLGLSLPMPAHGLALAESSLIESVFACPLFYAYYFSPYIDGPDDWWLLFGRCLPFLLAANALAASTVVWIKHKQATRLVILISILSSLIALGFFGFIVFLWFALAN
ncbi:MAG: hypothetical protein WCF84_05570 [Anaerolineae bacterium]